MTRREPIAFLLAHYSDVLDGVRDRVMGGRAGRRHRAHNRLDKETSLGFGQAIVLGLLCNALVCLAVSLTYGARTTADKILAIIPPIAAFVALGFEHSVANMYFIPVALLIKSDGSWMDTTAGVPDVNGLTWGSFLYDNLLPVTIGNIVGGAIMSAPCTGSSTSGVATRRPEPRRLRPHSVGTDSWVIAVAVRRTSHEARPAARVACGIRHRPRG